MTPPASGQSVERELSTLGAGRARLDAAFVGGAFALAVGTVTSRTALLESPFLTVTTVLVGAYVLLQVVHLLQSQEVRATEDGLLLGPRRRFVPFDAVVRFDRSRFRQAQFKTLHVREGSRVRKVRFVSRGSSGETDDEVWLRARIELTQDNRAT